MDESLAARVAAVAALDEPTRRSLYEYVVRQSGPVSRDEAAEAVGVPRGTAAFHLERLVDEELLDVVFQRRTGRTGPGAGRPAKLYLRSARQVGVSLPDRRYDLAGGLFAAAIVEAEQTGESPRAALDRLARDAGERLGQAARPDVQQSAVSTVLATLDALGFEPRPDGTDVVLANCPFQAFATAYTELVCGMNLGLVDGLLDGLDCAELSARLDPVAGRCCVRIVASAS